MNNRPFIGAVKQHAWHDKATNEKTTGLLIAGRSGIAAHVTKPEAYALADWIVDAADRLPEEQTPKPAYARHSAPLTAADGTPEQPLPATSADNE